MRRREFITLLGGATVTGPRPVIAQTPSKVHRLGLLTTVAPMTDNSPFGAPLIRGLAKYGYTGSQPRIGAEPFSGDVHGG
jgi:putative ABC transport system substrate-binding protein